MGLSRDFGQSKGRRAIVIDEETTGLFWHEGDRIVDIALIETLDGKPTGREMQVYFNPERDMPERVLAIHGLTREFLADKPLFAEKAKEIRDFIGDDPVVITCRTTDMADGSKYVLDRDMLNGELEKAGVKKVPEAQWENVRRWAEEMWSFEEGKLDKQADRYQIDRSDRDKNGHGAMRDAVLLMEVYPHIKKDYDSFKFQKDMAALGEGSLKCCLPKNNA